MRSWDASCWVKAGPETSVFSHPDTYTHRSCSTAVLLAVRAKEGTEGWEQGQPHLCSPLHTAPCSRQGQLNPIHYQAYHRRVGEGGKHAGVRRQLTPHHQGPIFSQSEDKHTQHTGVHTCACALVYVRACLPMCAHTHRPWSLYEPPSLQHPGATLTCDVVHHHSHCGVPDVAGNQAAEPLLASCVPQLQPHLSQGGQGGQCNPHVGWGLGKGPGSVMLALPALW